MKNKKKSIWCKLGLHNWVYTKHIHYKYRGPVNEYHKTCKDCGKHIEICSSRDYNYKWERICKEIHSKSSC